MEIPRIKIELPEDLALPLLGVFPKETIEFLKDMSTPKLVMLFTHDSQDKETT